VYDQNYPFLGLIKLHPHYVDLIIINLIPGTYSPISLLEIGLFTNLYSNNDNMIICCPEGFWRKGNIEIISNKFILCYKLIHIYSLNKINYHGVLCILDDLVFSFLQIFYPRLMIQFFYFC